MGPIDSPGSDDARLVRRVLHGEVEAYAALVARYRDRLWRYAIHVLRNREDAEDAVQEALVRAYRALPRSDPERFGSWLFQILVNRCRTIGGVRAHRDGLITLDEGAIERAAVEDGAERQAWHDAIHWALDQLSAAQREAFLLKHVEDLSYEEMAALTGDGVSALKMRVKRPDWTIGWDPGPFSRRVPSATRPPVQVREPTEPNERSDWGHRWCSAGVPVPSPPGDRPTR